MNPLCYTCRACHAPTRHRDALGPLCPWCAADAAARWTWIETAYLAQAAAYNDGRPRWAGRAFAAIIPRSLEGHRR